MAEEKKFCRKKYEDLFKENVMILIKLKRILKIQTCILPVLLVAMLLLGCQKKNEYVAPPPPTVTVSRPARQVVINYAEFTGTTQAVESVELRARVEGFLEQILFKDSARVQKGDLLFVIDPKPFQAKVDQAEADLMVSRAELKLAQTTLKLKEGAFKDRAVSEVEVIEARAKRDKARASVEAAQAAVYTVRLNLSYTKIHAPISGKIGRNLVDIGNLVGAGERTLLATIVQNDPIYAYFNVSESDLLRYQQEYRKRQTPTNGNGKTRVYLGLSNESGYPHKGRVDYVDNRVHATTGTIQVRGVFPNPDAVLLPGLFARIRATLGKQENALLVPERALGSDQQGRFVLVVNDRNIVEYRPIKIGAKVNGMRVIQSGVSADDRVIVNGLQRARPGAPVNPEQAETKAANEPKSSKDINNGENDNV